MLPETLLLLDISGGELLIIALVIFIILGPDKMPEMARKFGKAMRFVRKATDDIKREINIDEDIIQKPRNYAHTTRQVSKPETPIAQEPKTEKENNASPKEDNKTEN